MKGTRNTDRNTRKFITIRDTEMWEKIDKIMTLPQYKNTFNKVINDALFYGIDELYGQLFKNVKIEEADENGVQKLKLAGGTDEEYNLQTIRLLKEIILNETIMKSMVASIFHGKETEYEGGTVSPQMFKGGNYQGTPEYLVKYELQGLRNLRK